MPFPFLLLRSVENLTAVFRLPCLQISGWAARTLKLDHNFSQGAGCNKSMCTADITGRKPLFAEKRTQLTCFNKRCCLGEYFAMVRSIRARKQRKQGEYARVTRSTKRERSQRVRPPSQAAQHMAAVA